MAALLTMSRYCSNLAAYYSKQLTLDANFMSLLNRKLPTDPAAIIIVALLLILVLTLYTLHK